MEDEEAERWLDPLAFGLVASAGFIYESAEITPAGDVFRRSRRILLIACAASVTSLAGLGVAACGPSLYTFNAIPATQTLEQARQANATEHAPYEYYAARAYLDKSNEEAAEANYQDAIRFAEKAQQLGTKARDLSRRRMREAGR